MTDKAPASKLPPCAHCGSDSIVDNIKVGSLWSTGLRTTAFFNCDWEPLLASLCLDCGTVVRFHVKNTDKTWVQA